MVSWEATICWLILGRKQALVQRASNPVTAKPVRSCSGKRHHHLDGHQLPPLPRGRVRVQSRTKITLAEPRTRKKHTERERPLRFGLLVLVHEGMRRAQQDGSSRERSQDDGDDGDQSVPSLIGATISPIACFRVGGVHEMPRSDRQTK